MNCVNHPDIPAVAYCRTCGRALCEACQRTAQGTVYCAEHVPVTAPFVPPAPSPSPVMGPPSPGAAQAYAENLKQQIVAEPAPSSPPPAWKIAPGTVAAAPPYAVPGASPYAATGDAGASPGLAFVLGLIPGVGAIYNGQYVKGLIHVVILGILFSIATSESAAGFTPLWPMLIMVWWFYMAFEAYHTAKKRQLGQPLDEFSSIMPLHSPRRRFPAGPVILIGFGVLFLMNTMDILRFDRLIRFWPVLLILVGVYMLYERMTGPTASEPREASNERR